MCIRDRGDTDLLGMGVSAISMIGDCYAQNQKELKLYYQQVDETGDALWRGIAPVSYTHLDVYKRQGRSCSSMKVR